MANPSPKRRPGGSTKRIAADTVDLSIRVPRHLHAELKEMSRTTLVPQSSLVRTALERFLTAARRAR